MIIDVTDLTLKTLNFTRQYETSRRRRARVIYENEDVEIEEVEKINENNIIVSAKVNSSYLGQYDVTLKINKDYVREYSCTCEDFYNGYICKHILATTMETIEPHSPSTEEKRKEFLEKKRKEQEERYRLYLMHMEEEHRKREYQAKYSEALTAIGMFKKRKNIYSNEDVKLDSSKDLKELYETTKLEMNLKSNYVPNVQTQIRLEPRIEISRDQELYLSFKIGQTKMYILKDIEELYNAFLNESIIQYGKNLKFVAKEENFEKNSRELLKFILSYAQILKYNEKLNERYYYMRSPMSNKNIRLIDSKIDEFFNKVENIPIIINNYQEGKDEYRLTDKDIGLTLDVKKINNSDDYELMININGYDYVITPQNVYIFYENNIYRINKKEHKNIENILEMFKYNETI